MNRFFVDKVTKNKAVINDAEQFHHLKNVLRLKVDDEIALSDAEGNDYKGIITSIDRNQAEVKVTLKTIARKDSLKLTVACAIPKNTRFDDVIDFLTQLGVERIIPMMTERVIVKLDEKKSEERHQRWVKIAENAARQSQRSRIPIIEHLTGFNDVIFKAGEYELKLIPHLSGERTHIKDILAGSKPRNIIVLIGPEGDFTSDEAALAINSGFLPVSLGNTVLRVATAAIAVASFIQFAAGE